MSQFRAQHPEAFAPQDGQNGSTRSSSPAQTPSRPGSPILTGRRHSQSPASAFRRPSSAPGNKQGSQAAYVNGRRADYDDADDDDDDDDDDEDDSRNGSHNHASSSLTRPSKPPLLRSKTEHGLRHGQVDGPDDDLLPRAVAKQGAKHGFEGHYQSEDIIFQLANNWYMYFTDKRHETTGKPKVPGFVLQDWRMRDRLKTVSAAIAVCLNIGVEPPDQLRTTPGAKLEAWQDPTVPPVSKALENIGKTLQAQYETLAIRARYKQYLDPSIEETKKFSISLRRNAKDERVLFHYNGHGVPKPTASGEIWVFNKTYTQYIPVSLYDLQQWLQAPTIFVWDCSEAGNILNNYHRFVEKHEQEEDDTAAKDATYEKMTFRPYIHLASCGAKENLPTNPLLPADLFTCCLTTPIEMALWFFVLQNPLKTKLTPERARGLGGRLQERRTPLGELNWIFTAITDTIAWTTLPRHLFRKFFRQDLMVAALFRNFLLAQRIMPVYNCHPQSFPELPNTRQHPLWDSWDHAVDMALAQLPMLERKEKEGIEYEYVNSSFFTEQLTAFEVYLDRGDALAQKPPDQLPVVLQVLLSQQHRLRALILLGRFLDLGPWAVQLALSIGIFPYVLKLLQSAAQELKPVMVFIWTRVLAVDISCQGDLIKDSGYNYFAAIMKPQETFPVVGVAVLDEHKAMCAFILAMLCKNYRPGQIVCNSTEIMTYCLQHINHPENPLLRQWSCLCISQLWQDLPEGKWRGIRENAHLKLAFLIKDQCPEVRAAMVHAMTTFLGIPDLTDEVARIEEGIAWTMLDLATDGSPIVRKELLVFFSHFVLRYENKFLVAAHEQLLEEKEYLLFPLPDDGQDHRMGLHYARAAHRDRDGKIQPSAFGVAHDSVFAACWKHINILSVDPHPEVQRDATAIVDFVHHALLHSPVGEQAQKLIDEILKRARKVSRGDMSQRTSVVGTHTAVAQPMPSPGLLKRTASYLFGPLIGTMESPASAVFSPPTSPRLQRTLSQRSRKGPSLDAAPPEQNDQTTSPANYHVANEPTCADYKERSLTEVPTLPVTSTFLDWSIEYFREPQMKAPEPEEPGSNEYNKRLWRRSRNEAVLMETQPQKTHARTHKWNSQIGVINNGTQPAKMTFHQFENHVAVADDGNTINIWDWKTNARKSRFSNGNPEGSKISEVKFINEDDQALLMTGSSDGVLRVYRNYDSDENVELASAWRALTHMVPSNVNSGMVFDWQQVNGQVLVAGDERVIRIWNAGHEMCSHEIPARSGSCVTALTSDQMTGNIFIAGFGDGAIRVFDTRNRPQESMVRKWKDDNRQWVRTVHMQRGGQRELVSASRNGMVRLWDIRKDKPLATFGTTAHHVLRTASVHEHLPVLAVGTSVHTVRVFDLDGRIISSVEPYSGFLQGHKDTPISVTAFHPHRMLLGCAARGDHRLNLFACGNERVERFDRLSERLTDRLSDRLSERTSERG
ncbi:raptor N-terminal caspase like domain-containing protein [Lasiosphaeria miniovina]|uniref:Raptor N-terminal caspase like domain-containing protein n=1 Tax=Lasiosphaeria miniovina TaxID=1954250 RepID=A0AA39ZU75_9PEZI|nr:raptor N-terminal caspase like domain-containing protein [Lasiosphaeria miniovina]KAK0703585.1 raptor N-terminal caspase like domain-containing protein [Lasiosphaeria miniovina]